MPRLPRGLSANKGTAEGRRYGLSAVRVRGHGHDPRARRRDACETAGGTPALLPSYPSLRPLFTSGTRFGPYEILGSLGEGGMGEVYKARDTRLDRTVALKVLPSGLSDDPETRMRFEREARAISALSHPNICTLFDIGKANGQDFLVMEFLDGETLAQRLERGPMDVDEIVRVGTEISDALEKAHRQGIVHRDLKPGNIVITRGHAKLLDFGLAKWMPAEGSALPRADDLTAPLTMKGFVMGTIPYMSPEQLEGKDVDARADIFSLGAILYEMATGVRAFNATSNASLIVAIMREEPTPIAQIRKLTPRGLEQIVRICLAKNPDERFQSAHDVRLALHMLRDATSVLEVPARRRRWLVPLALSLAALAALALAARMLVRPTKDPRTYRFHVYPPPGSSFPSLGEGGGIALSPDGTQLLFEATGADGRPFLWLRALNEEEAKLLVGTEGGEYPFWSPDGKNIGFFADGKLKRMALPGGPAQTICDAPSPRGGAWSAKDVILFAPFLHGPLHRVPAAGGQPVPLSLTTTEAYSQRWPAFLDDDRFVFVAQSKRAELHGLFAGSLGSRETRRLLPDALSVAFVPPDRLYFVRDDVLVEQRLDAKGALIGDAATVTNQIVYYEDRAYVPITAAADGTLAFRRNGAASLRIAWVTRDGLRQSVLGDAGEYEGVSISPDGSRVTYGYFDAKESLNHIAIASLPDGAPRRFTFARGNQYSAVWSPDGSRVAFSDDQAGVDTLSVRPLSGTGNERPLIPHPPSSTYAQSWSPDGARLLYRTQNPKSGYDVRLLTLASGETADYIAGPGDQSQAQFSPDGRWVAYTSTESGRLEVYVQPFPATGARWQVSTAGGEQARWRRDGRELFYLAPDRTLMSVPLAVPGVFDAEAPRVLFHAPRMAVGDINVSQSYDVAPDGRRFVIIAADPGSQQSPLTVVTR